MRAVGAGLQPELGGGGLLTEALARGESARCSFWLLLSSDSFSKGTFPFFFEDLSRDPSFQETIESPGETDPV